MKALIILTFLMVGCPGAEIGVSAERSADGSVKVELDFKKDLPAPAPPILEDKK